MGHGSGGVGGVHGGHGGHGAHGAHGAHGGKHPAKMDHGNRYAHGQHGKSVIPNSPSGNQFMANISQGAIQSSYFQFSAGASQGSPSVLIVIMMGGQGFGYDFQSDTTFSMGQSQAVQPADQPGKSNHTHHKGHHGTHHHGGTPHAHSGHGHHSGVKGGGKGGHGHGGGHGGK